MFAMKTPQKNGLEKAIDSLLEEMSHLNGDSEEFAAMAAQLDVLYRLKEVDSNVASKKHVSADTWAAVAANLAGIAMIVGHERASVVTSKALSLLMKIK